MWPARRLHDLRRDQRGSALVEFAVGMPVLLVVLFACVEIGRMVIAYHDIDRQVRAAGRFIARIPCDSIPLRLAEAQNLALYGRTEPGTSPTPLYAYWTTATGITITPDPPVCGTTTALTLTGEATVGFPYLALIGLPTSITLAATHRERLIPE